MLLAYPEAPQDYNADQQRAWHGRIIASIREVLSKSDEAFLLDPRLDLENFIHRNCWLAGIHPAVPLVALQREQGLLGKDGVAASERAFSRATGWVGQHLPGTASVNWDGLTLQIQLCIRSAAWHGGIGDKAAFGYRPGLWPTSRRWQGAAMNVDLLNLDGSFNRKQLCMDPMTYVDWVYTPNALKNVPAENDQHFERYVKPSFLWSTAC